MAIREKVNSIYVSKQEDVAINALERFKANRNKLALTHSDIYKAGLALYAVNPTLIVICKMLMMNDKLTAKYLAQYFSTELGENIHSSFIDKPQNNNGVDELSLLLNQQSNKIEQLSALIVKQSQMIEKLSLDNQKNSTGLTNQTVNEIEVAKNTINQDIQEEDIPESLEAYDENGRTKLSGVVKDTAHIGSSKTREKIRAFKSHNIL